MDAPGVLVLPPFYYKASDEGVFRFFAQLIERIGDERLRICLYHFPQMTGIGFDPSLIERLLKMLRVAGLTVYTSSYEMARALAERGCTWACRRRWKGLQW